MKISAINSRLMLPLLLALCLMVSFTCIIDYFLFKWLLVGFQPLFMAPVAFLLADESFVVGRTGMLIHYHTRHTQEGLREFLVGNGAKQFEALLPYYRHVISRTLVLSAWRWLLVGLVVLFALCVVWLAGTLSWTVVLWLLSGLLASVVFCSVVTLLLSAFLYDRLNK